MPTMTNPLPSLIRASAWDDGNRSMAKAGRASWSRKDYNTAARTQERLVRACYGYPTDAADSEWCYIRFSIAEGMQKAGTFAINSKMADIYRAIDAALAA